MPRNQLAPTELDSKLGPSIEYYNCPPLSLPITYVLYSQYSNMRLPYIIMTTRTWVSLMAQEYFYGYDMIIRE